MRDSVDSDHYKSVADQYDSLYSFNQGYYSWLINKVSEYLELKQSDRLVDLGGGTGHIAKRIYEHSKLDNDILCVDPSQAMLDKAKELVGVIPYNCDALKFSKEKDQHYDKMLLAGIIHYLDQKVEIFEGLFKQLYDKGKILIVTRPKRTSLPFFSKALESFDNSQTSLSDIENELKLTHFHIKVTKEIRAIKIPKLQWYKSLRERFMSHLSNFSNDEIEIGIKELEEKFKDKKTIDVVDTIIFILLTK